MQVKTTLLFDDWTLGLYTTTIMKILDKYFSRQLVTIFVMLLLILTGLAWMVQIMSMMKFLLNYGIALSNFLGLTVLMIPFIISIIIPFVCFISVIFVYNKMISDNEITVMMASGLSPHQIARPALRLAGLLTLVHFLLNLWIVPASQSYFYTTQWNLRYGLAHMKLQESAFTQLSNGLVVYVDKVAGHDLSQVMLSDTRDKNSSIVIFAEQGKLVSTPRGLSIVMQNGSLQSNGKNMTTGTFDSFDMDLNIADKGGDTSFKVRRISTLNLIKSVLNAKNAKQQRLILSELCNRFLNPLMNLILVAVCTLILLRTSLLRRRASFAPLMAVTAMAAIMSLFMSATNMVNSFTDLFLLTMAVFGTLGLITFALYRR
ncbi:MAG: LptF/LptG family permease [Alphaproteobacteria bacterium]|nr:LptF/LptG family permease [Alphaproteobacteria bacterium]